MVLVRDSETLRLLDVQSISEHTCTLSDGSEWYHTGYPLRGYAGVRLVLASKEMLDRIERQGAVRRLAEMATVVYELAEKNRVPVSELVAAERLLMRIIEEHTSDTARAEIWGRLRAAEKFAVNRPIADLEE